jgi:hypothetical protein
MSHKNSGLHHQDTESSGGTTSGIPDKPLQKRLDTEESTLISNFRQSTRDRQCTILSVADLAARNAERETLPDYDHPLAKPPARMISIQTQGEVTLGDLRNAVVKIIEQILQNHGADHLQDLAPEHYPKVFGVLQTLLIQSNIQATTPAVD